MRTDHGSLAWLMRFRLISGMLARWLEELAQFDMEILNRKGVKHVNADALSRIPDDFIACDCYRAGVSPTDLPCGGCNTCTRAHQRWSWFEDEVDDIVPLSVRCVSVDSIEERCILVQDTTEY